MINFHTFYTQVFSAQDPATYWKQYPVGQLLFKENILSLLKECIAEQNAEELTYILIMAFKDGVDKDYTDILMRLLEENWHTEQENIVSLLEDAMDPKSIEILYETAVNVPDYDEMRALAKKCIWALWAIKTPEANEKLKLLQRNNDEIIRDTATQALSEKNKSQ